MTTALEHVGVCFTCGQPRGCEHWPWDAAATAPTLVVEMHHPERKLTRDELRAWLDRSPPLPDPSEAETQP